jgi:hypothetical protein
MERLYIFEDVYNKKNSLAGARKGKEIKRRAQKRKRVKG